MNQPEKWVQLNDNNIIDTRQWLCELLTAVWWLIY